MSVIEVPRISGEPSGDEVSVSGVDIADIDHQSFTHMGLNPVEHKEPSGEVWIEWVDPSQPANPETTREDTSVAPPETPAAKPETESGSPADDLGQFVLNGHFRQ